MWKVLLGMLLGSAMAVCAQEAVLEDFGAAVKRSLERSRAVYPEAALPDSPLSEAVMARISWYQQRNPSIFSDPDWPMKITAAEAARLGIQARTQSTTAMTGPASGKYLAVVTKSFSQVGVSFRKGQQIILESLLDYKKKGVVMQDGEEVIVWMDNIKIIRPLAQNEGEVPVIKIESAKYGLPGQSGYSVSDTVQSMVSPGGGAPQILVTDALLPTGAAARLNRNAAPRTVLDPKTGQPVTVVSGKILTVTYTINGLEKTKQAVEGQTMVLD